MRFMTSTCMHRASDLLVGVKDFISVRTFLEATRIPAERLWTPLIVASVFGNLPTRYNFICNLKISPLGTWLSFVDVCTVAKNRSPISSRGQTGLLVSALSV